MTVYIFSTRGSARLRRRQEEQRWQRAEKATKVQREQKWQESQGSFYDV